MPDERLWEVVRIQRCHARSDFSCGVEPLDTFLRKYARQNDALGIGRTYVATRPGDLRVLGFFTIRSGEIAFSTFPVAVRRRLPRYPVPVVHLGRLAVDREAQGRGLGEHLLVEALARAVRVSETLAVFAVEVTAKDETARRFYRKYGFRSLLDDELHLYLSIGAARRAFEIGG